MANNGWFKMYRAFQDWEYYKNNNVKILWLHILLNTEYNGAEKGTYKTKIDDLSTALDMTRDQVKYSLALLEDSKQIAKCRRGKYLLITVLNWGKYQGNGGNDTFPRNSPEISPQFSPQFSTEKKQGQTVDTKGIATDDENENSPEISTENSTEDFRKFPPSTLHYIEEVKKEEEEIHFLARNSKEVLDRDAILYPDGWIE